VPLDLEVAFQYAGLLAVRASLLAHILLCSLAACHEIFSLVWSSHLGFVFFLIPAE